MDLPAGLNFSIQENVEVEEEEDYLLEEKEEKNDWKSQITRIR